MTHSLENGFIRDLPEPYTLIRDRHPEWLEHGIQIIPSSITWNAYYPLFNTGIATMLDFAESEPDYGSLQLLLTRAYPESTPLLLTTFGSGNELDHVELTLGELRDSEFKATTLVISPLEGFSVLEHFMNTVTHLRSPEGCPWDRKQTHASLRTYLMEETFEALEAMDREDIPAVREELGDILLQIALHSVIGNENGEFKISDVISGIDRKIISRHPHVFDDVVVTGEKDVLVNWDKLKREEKEENGKGESSGMLEGIPSILPALSQAQALQQRAARVGFDWPEIKPVLAKVFEELEELKTALGKPQEAEELGDLLFAMVNLVRWYEVDAESALRQANQKFRKRFAFIERRAREMDREMTSMTLEEMDRLWEEAKGQETKSS